MSANVEAMIRAGIDAFRSGNKADARALLERAIELDDYNELAWLWLAAVVETPEEQRTCLENVLVINPNNDRARQGLKSLGIDPDATRAAAAPPEESAPAFSYDSADDLFGDADFGAPVSSGKSDEKVSGNDYDNWVGGLNLGKKSSPEPMAFDEGDSPFGSFDFGSSTDEIFTDDDDFGTGASAPAAPAYTPPPAAPATSGSSARPLSASAFTEDSSVFEAVNTPFSDDAFERALASNVSEEEFADLLGEDVTAGEELGGQLDNAFSKIPLEIVAADRLPGMDEPAPRGGLIVVALLGLLNLGAFGFLISRLLG